MKRLITYRFSLYILLLAAAGMLLANLCKEGIFPAPFKIAGGSIHATVNTSHNSESCLKWQGKEEQSDELSVLLYEKEEKEDKEDDEFISFKKHFEIGSHAVSPFFTYSFGPIFTGQPRILSFEKDFPCASSSRYLRFLVFRI